MGNLSILVSAAVVMVAVVTLFALIRRVMHSPRAPSWFTASVVAFALAFGMTVLFATSIFYVANALQTRIPNVVVAGLLAMALHVVTWSIIRVIIPIGRGNTDHTPHAGLTGGGAIPSAT
jgi:hypothetical protein